MSAVACRNCKGSGRFYDRKSGKTFDCRACGGSGINRSLWSTRCQRCRTEIVYKAGNPAPTHCKSCRSIQLEKQCATAGCHNTIRYKPGWNDIPNYCRYCTTQRSRGSTASTCPGTGLTVCGKVVWSPPGKKYVLCRECNERKRAQDAAKWREKSCPGLKGQSCGKTIKYHVDWAHPPNLCQDCREKAKKVKAERESKMREKTCARSGCSNTVRYSTDWDHPPSFCKSCSEKRKALQTEYPNINRKVDTRDTSYVMPGMGKTIGQMGGTRGMHYPRQGKIHCMIFEGMGGDDLHYAWDLDPISGEITKGPYIHPNDPSGE